MPNLMGNSLWKFHIYTYALCPINYIPYVIFYLWQSQITADPRVDANPESFAIISSTIDISIIWSTNSSSPSNTHSERSSSAWWSKMGDENKQVGILTFICINMGTQNTVNMEYV